MGSPRSIARHRSAYRALLVLYPRSFRQEYGEPMAQLFGDRLRDVGPRVWLRAVPDLIRTVPSQRIEAVMADLGPGPRVVALAFVVLGAALVAMRFGGGVIPLIAFAVVMIVVTQRRMFTSVPLGRRAPLRHAVVQAWWAPVAGLLGLMMVLAGVGTIFEAHNWGGRIVGSGLLIAFGVAMMLGLMRRPLARQSGNSMILLATVPPLLFFWMIVPPLAAIVVWIGVISSGFGDQPVASPAA
jgi:hypothetical protein